MQIFVLEHDTRKNGVGHLNGEAFSFFEDALNAVKKFFIDPQDFDSHEDSEICFEGLEIGEFEWSDTEDHISIYTKEIPDEKKLSRLVFEKDGELLPVTIKVTPENFDQLNQMANAGYRAGVNLREASKTWSTSS